MPAYETSITIAAPCETVWPVLSDVAAWPQWLPTVTSVQPLDGRALAVGARYVVHQPGLRSATWVVTELEPARRFAWRARSPGIKMLGEHDLHPDSSVSSTLVLRFTFAGPLGGLVGRLARSITENYIAQEAAALKHRVEASSQA